MKKSFLFLILIIFILNTGKKEGGEQLKYETQKIINIPKASSTSPVLNDLIKDELFNMKTSSLLTFSGFSSDIIPDQNPMFIHHSMTSIASMATSSIELGSSFPQYIYLYTQEEVDRFGSFHYNKIKGSLVIGDPNRVNTSITDLSSLSTITSVGRDLKIENNAMLTNLYGLDNIISVKGNLEIWNNAILPNLSGLDNIASVKGFLSISNNDLLTEISGLSKLTSLRRRLYIDNNDHLSSLCGISPLFENGFDKECDIYSNAYNPTKEDMISGKCKFRF